MRTFSTALKGELDKRFGTQPIVIVEVEWSDGAAIAYTDCKLNGANYPYPFLVSIGQFDSKTITSGTSDDQNVSIVLSDVDGSISDLLKQHDLHLNKVSVSLGYQGVDFSERALLFEGVINSPVVWDEGSRTLSFEVFSKLEDQEAGFSMDDGDFPYIPPSDRNKPWPLVFGKVCNQTATRVTTLRKGYLAEGQGVKDPTIEERLCQAYKLQCPTRKAEVTAAAPAGAPNTLPNTRDPTLPVPTIDTSGQTNIKSNKPDQQCMTRRMNEICSILREKEQQEAYVKTSLTIRGGESFPQNETIKLKIGDVFFDGVMSGTLFTITQVYHPDVEEIDNPPCKDIQEARIGYRFRPSLRDNPQSVANCNAGGTNYGADIVNGSGKSWEYYNEFEKGNFIWLAPGTEVFLAEEAEVVNIVSLLPGTVDQVAAYRTFSDTTLLMEVPTSRYTVHTTDYGGYDVVEVRLDAPLSTIQGEKWDDTLFVSFTSSVGPNPVDVIQWLIEKYTQFTFDAANFASIKTKMTNYPVGFAVTNRPSVLKLMRDIAYQCRMGLTIRAGLVRLYYLSEEPTSERTLTYTDDMLPNTLKISYTETEDLVTKHEFKWSNGDAGITKDSETDFSFVLKHNVPQYGTIEKSFDYYTQNTYSTIEKSGTFWMIRNANTWKYVEFDTPMKHLELDIFDCVTLTGVPGLPASVKVVIEEAMFNAETNSIHFKAWTPVLAGTNEAYYWAWPATREQLSQFPLVDRPLDVEGDGYDFEVVPPEGHPLRAGYDPETARLATAGDRYPSDIGDTFPLVDCTTASDADISDEIEPEFVPFEPLAEQNFQDKLDSIESGNTNASGGDSGEEREAACGDPGPPGAGCQYEVTVTYVIPGAVTTRQNPGSTCRSAGPCGSGQGQTGNSCYGPTYQMCHSFGAAFAARAFQTAKRAEAQALQDNCGYTVGKSDVLSVSGVGGIPSDGYAGECDASADDADAGGGGGPGGSQGGAPAGELGPPGCKSGPCPPQSECAPGAKRNAAGICTQSAGTCPDGTTANQYGACVHQTPCNPGSTRDARTGQCVQDGSTCPAGTTVNEYGACVDDGE